jgi:hypothetical protein
MPGPGDAEGEDQEEQTLPQAGEQPSAEEQEPSAAGAGPEEGGSDLPVVQEDEQSTTG